MNIKLMIDKVKKINQKNLIIIGFCSLLFIWFLQHQSAQGEYEQMESEYKSQISDLESQVQAKQEYIAQVNESIEEIGSEVDRFEYEDWRDVTPDVYSSAKKMVNNIEQEP